jgi:hypothetical protein
MSLALDVSRVEQVLLMDGWHRVAIPSMGGRWTEPDGSEVACPVTAILAVKKSSP